MNTPARKLTKSAVKNIVRFPSIKANNGKSILVESILESKYCLHLEFDSRVKTYSPQPKTFSFLTNDGVERTYTPDFEVQYLSGERRFVEVKPLNRVLKENYQELFQAFEATLECSDAGFLLVDESEIYQLPLLSNYEKLYQFRKRPSLDMSNLHHCADLIGLTVPLKVLIRRLEGEVTIREIYTWLAMRYLIFDLEAELLTMDTEVMFSVD